VRFTVGFLITGLDVAAGGKNKGTAVALGVAVTVPLLGAWVMRFLTVDLPLRASIMI
jgi:hypothetical protein